MERRLVGMLCARGTDRELPGDISQEVAARVLTHDVAFTSADDLYRWCACVARRLRVDEYRRTRRVDVTEAVPEAPSSYDLVGQVIDGLSLEVLRERLRALEPAERAVLFQTPPVAERGAWYVRRHRLRAALARSLASVTIAVATLHRWLRGRASSPATHAVVMAATMAVPVADDALGGHTAVRSAEPPVTVGTTSAPETATAGGAEVAAGVVAEAADARPAQPPASRTPPPVEVRTPVEARVATPPAGGRTAYGEVENGEEDEPAACIAGVPVVADRCVDYPAPSAGVRRTVATPFVRLLVAMSAGRRHAFFEAATGIEPV